MDEISGFNCSSHSTGRHSDGPGQREPQGLRISSCWLIFWGTWCKFPRGTMAVGLQFPWSSLPTLPPPNLALGSLVLSSTSIHPTVTISTVEQISVVFRLQFASPFLPAFLDFHHLTAEWQTCPRAVYLTLTFTPRLRSENEKWHHPVHQICSTSAIHRPK